MKELPESMSLETRAAGGLTSTFAPGTDMQFGKAALENARNVEMLTEGVDALGGRETPRMSPPKSRYWNISVQIQSRRPGSFEGQLVIPSSR